MLSGGRGGLPLTILNAGYTLHVTADTVRNQRTVEAPRWSLTIIIPIPNVSEKQSEG